MNPNATTHNITPEEDAALRNRLFPHIETFYFPKEITPRFTWIATRKGWQQGQPVGHGETREDAIAHLIANEEVKQ